MKSKKEIESPCNKICVYESAEVHVCAGCGRTKEEITEWSAASHERKKQIIKAAKKRRSKK